VDKLNKTLVDNWVRIGLGGFGAGEKRERGGGCIPRIPAYQTVFKTAYQTVYTFVYQKFVRNTQTIKPV
jgi:hypothetical protein